MPKKSSSPPFSKNAGFFPAVLLLLLLQAGLVGAAPWYFLPNFGHDVRWVQGFADGYFATARTPPPHPAACVPAWKPRCCIFFLKKRGIPFDFSGFHGILGSCKWFLVRLSPATTCLTQSPAPPEGRFRMFQKNTSLFQRLYIQKI